MYWQPLFRYLLTLSLRLISDISQITLLRRTRSKYGTPMCFSRNFTLLPQALWHKSSSNRPPTYDGNHIPLIGFSKPLTRMLRLLWLCFAPMYPKSEQESQGTWNE